MRKAREKFLAIMREQGRRMARLVDDLLSLSRIEQNQHVRPEAADRSCADRAARRRHAGAAGAGNGRRNQIDAEQPVIVAGDRDELVRVAENLIENAIKYGARRGRLGRRPRRSVGRQDGARGLARACATTGAASRRNICRG